MRATTLVWMGAAALLPLVAGGCGRGDAVQVEAVSWKAPHGGSIVWLPDRQHALELLHEGGTGRLSAWLLGATDGRAARRAEGSLDLMVHSGGDQAAPRVLVMPPTADGAGWSAEAAWLRCPGPLTGSIPLLKVGERENRGITFVVTSALSFDFSLGAENTALR